MHIPHSNLDYKFSSNQNQLKDTSNILNFHISATFHIILKTDFRNFAKSFVKKILAIS